MAASSRLITVRDGEPVRYPSQQSRVGLTPGNPHAFPWIRIWRGRRAPAQLSAADVRCRACLMAYSRSDMLRQGPDGMRVYGLPRGLRPGAS